MWIGPAEEVSRKAIVGEAFGNKVARRYDASAEVKVAAEWGKETWSGWELEGSKMYNDNFS